MLRHVVMSRGECKGCVNGMLFIHNSGKNFLTAAIMLYVHLVSPTLVACIHSCIHIFNGKRKKRFPLPLYFLRHMSIHMSILCLCLLSDLMSCFWYTEYLQTGHRETEISTFLMVSMELKPCYGNQTLPTKCSSSQQRSLNNFMWLCFDIYYVQPQMSKVTFRSLRCVHRLSSAYYCFLDASGKPN